MLAQQVFHGLQGGARPARGSRGVGLIGATSCPSGTHTHPVGLGRPATLQAPFAGPDGNSS